MQAPSLEESYRFCIEVPRGRESAVLEAVPAKTTAEPFVPETRSLQKLRKAAASCEGCDLYENATQVVFGEGAKDAALFVIGEQPGDKEDEQGHPFVGPAGKILARAFEEAKIERKAIFLTNAVKHFKWKASGKRRLHAKPGAREVAACKPWLKAELDIVQPEIIITLGATAAQSLMGRSFRLTANRGKVLPCEYCKGLVATVHPSLVLRAPDKRRREAYQELVTDLALAATEAGCR